MKPRIRAAVTPDGDIEAAVDLAHRLTVDRRTGNVVESNVKEGTDMFRWLVNEARRHIAL